MKKFKIEFEPKEDNTDKTTTATVSLGTLVQGQQLLQWNQIMDTAILSEVVFEKGGVQPLSKGRKVIFEREVYSHCLHR